MFNKKLGLKNEMVVKQKKVIRVATYLFTNQMAHEYLSARDRSYPGVAESFL